MPCKPLKVKKIHSGIIIPYTLTTFDKNRFFVIIWLNVIMAGQNEKS